MIKTYLFRFPALCLFVFTIGVSPGTSHADLIITGATDPKIEVGKKLPDDTRLDIPADITISILKLPDQETFVVKGPFKGTLQEYVKKKTCRWIDRFFGRCGHEDASTPPVGGVRAIRPKTEE